MRFVVHHVNDKLQRICFKSEYRCISSNLSLCQFVLQSLIGGQPFPTNTELAGLKSKKQSMESTMITSRSKYNEEPMRSPTPLWNNCCFLPWEKCDIAEGLIPFGIGYVSTSGRIFSASSVKHTNLNSWDKFLFTPPYSRFTYSGPYLLPHLIVITLTDIQASLREIWILAIRDKWKINWIPTYEFCAFHYRSALPWVLQTRTRVILYVDITQCKLIRKTKTTFRQVTFINVKRISIRKICWAQTTKSSGRPLFVASKIAVKLLTKAIVYLIPKSGKILSVNG